MRALRTETIVVATVVAIVGWTAVFLLAALVSKALLPPFEPRLDLILGLTVAGLIVTLLFLLARSQIGALGSVFLILAAVSVFVFMTALGALRIFGM